MNWPNYTTSSPPLGKVEPNLSVLVPLFLHIFLISQVYERPIFYYVLQINLNIFHVCNKMKFIFTILSILFLPIFCLQGIKPKLCINCKYFITDNNTDKYSRCILFPIEEDKRYFLVNGDIAENKNEYHYCVVARQMENLCGSQGKMYKKKYIKKGIS